VAKDYVEQRSGAYLIAGTRVSLDSVVHAFLRGESLVGSEAVPWIRPNCPSLTVFTGRPKFGWLRISKKDTPTSSIFSLKVLVYVGIEAELCFSWLLPPVRRGSRGRSSPPSPSFASCQTSVSRASPRRRPLASRRYPPRPSVQGGRRSIQRPEALIAVSDLLG
jgi:hypothetical protein